MGFHLDYLRFYPFTAIFKQVKKNNLVEQEAPHKSPFGGCAFQLPSAGRPAFC
jgi:hypothetical protein